MNVWSKFSELTGNIPLVEILRLPGGLGKTGVILMNIDALLMWLEKSMGFSLSYM